MFHQRSSFPTDGKYVNVFQFNLSVINKTSDLSQLRNTIPEGRKLQQFLYEALPETLGPSKNPLLQKLRTREDFIADAVAALKLAPMSIRLTPQILSRIDWEDALDDPIRKQFLPLASGIIGDHKKLTLDSLHEEADSREYPDWLIWTNANNFQLYPVWFIGTQAELCFWVSYAMP